MSSNESAFSKGPQVGHLSSSTPSCRNIDTESIRDLLSDWVIDKKQTAENGTIGSEEVQPEETVGEELEADTPLRYSQEVQDKPILMCDDSSIWPSCQLSHLLRLWEKSYAGEGADTKFDIIKEIKKIINDRKHLANEFCLQIIKQTNGNPNPLPLWDLFEKVLEHLEFSKEVANFACDYFRAISCSGDGDRAVREKVFDINNLLAKSVPPGKPLDHGTRRTVSEPLSMSQNHHLPSCGSSTMPTIYEAKPSGSFDMPQSANSTVPNQVPSFRSPADRNLGNPTTGGASINKGNSVGQPTEEEPVLCGCLGIFSKKESSEQQPPLGQEESIVPEGQSTVTTPAALSTQISQSFPDSGAGGQNSQDQLEGLAPGTLLNKYILQTVNDGHKKTIRSAFHQLNGQEVVLKFYESQEEGERAFEFHKANRSKYFCSMQDSFIVDLGGRKRCIVFEKGTETLSDWMKVQHTDLEKRGVLRKVGVAIENLHLLGYVHRDLKPDNIMRFGDDWKLIDFDSVCLIGQMSKIVYTLKYAAPEVVKAETQRGETMKAQVEQDIWSLGIICYEVFAQGHRFYANISNNRLKQFITTELNEECIVEKLKVISITKEKSLVQNCTKLRPEDRLPMSKFRTRAIFNHAPEDTTTIEARLDEQNKELKYLRTQTTQRIVKVSSQLEPIRGSTATVLANPAHGNAIPVSDENETNVFDLQEGANYQLITKLSLMNSSEEAAWFKQVVDVTIETALGEVIELLPQSRRDVSPNSSTIRAVIDGERLRADIQQAAEEFSLKLVINLEMEIRKYEGSRERIGHECSIESYIQCKPQRSGNRMRSIFSFGSKRSKSTTL